MNTILLGGLLGLVFGTLDIIPMYFMKGFDNKRTAMIAAFIERFSIGLLIGAAQFPIPAVLQGLLISILISIPTALITKAYVPVMTTAVIGGAVIGFAVGQWGL
ncbi:MAG: hypothetical protein KC546_13490 [Anaerolineae bacterium]|nr:hypothetical protein [Anaerolineae bacterium]